MGKAELEAIRKRRGLISEQDADKVSEYIFKKPDIISREELMAEPEFGKRMVGLGKFSDTGRQSSGYGEALDSLTGAPLRTGLDDAAQNGLSFNTLKKMAQAIGKDPQNAPTGFDVASHMPIENPYVGAAVASAIDMANLPMPGVGVAGTVYRQGKALSKKDAAKAIDELVEQAKAGKNIYHGTTKQVADKIGANEFGRLYPDKGKIVRSAYGEYLNQDEYPNALADAVFFAEKPGYMGASKIWNKPNFYEKSRSEAFIKKHGGLAVVEKSDDFLKNAAGLNGDPEYKSLISEKGINPFDNEATPINIERGDIFATDAVRPDYVLTENDLTDFLSRAFPDKIQKAAIKKRLGKTVAGKAQTSKKAQGLLDSIKTPQQAVALKGAD